MAVKGKTNNPNGKPKGVQNKATLEFKEAVKNLIEFATPQMVQWLEKVAEEDPAKALDHVYKFAQFGHPLLARQEVQQLDKNGAPTDPADNLLTWLAGLGNNTPSEEK